MCGLFGFNLSEEFPATNRAILAAVLAIKNEDRGEDSFGYYAPETGEHIRGVGEISQGLDVAKMAAHRSIIGHTRQATTGAVNVENSHPLRVGNIIGAHNGIVSGHEAMNKKFGTAFSVDSCHLLHVIDQGLDESEIVAQGALIWTAANDPLKRIIAVKFNGGILAISGIKNRAGDFVGTAWSSRDGDLNAAVSIALPAGFSIYPYKVEDNFRYRLGADQAYFDADKKFSPDNFISIDWKDDLSKYYGSQYRGPKLPFSSSAGWKNDCVLCGKTAKRGEAFCRPCASERSSYQTGLSVE